MPLYTKKSFSELTGINHKDVSIYKRRQKIVYKVVDGKEMIDSEDPINALFVDERILVMAKKGKPNAGALAAAQGAKKETAEGGGDGSKNEGGNIYDLVEQKKELDVEIAKREIIKRDLDIEKKRGEVIPVIPIENIVFQYKQLLLVNEKISYERFLNEISHKYDITPDDIAYYRGYFIKGLNESFNTADLEFKNKLEGILIEYSIRRGIGERN